MSGDFSLCCIPRLSSWLSLVHKRVSSAGSSSPPASPYYQYSLLPRDSAESLVIPVLQAYTDVVPGDTSPRPSISNAPPRSITISIPSHASPTLPPSPPDSPSSQQPLLFLDEAEGLDTLGHHADTESSLSPPSAANAPCPGSALIPQRPANHLGGSICQNLSPTCLAPLPLPQLPTEQASVFPGSSYMFNRVHNFFGDTALSNDHKPIVDNFMENLLQETIIGAESASSAHDLLPSCLPETSAAIIRRCLDFIVECQGEGKLCCVVGPAGAGKSAIVQMVTKNVPNDVIFASVFLSVNGRRDGAKIILTIAHQLAVKSEPYRQFIRDQITHDPCLLRKSLSSQFKKLIVEPLILKHVFGSPRRFLIAIDGLNECDNPLTQRKLLELISDFCITYPTSPIAWIIASRPEPHITSFFGKPEFQRAYTKEEIEIDSDEVCEDVHRYLRTELKKIKFANSVLSHKREWPLEYEFAKIASAAAGPFAYAATVVRYIGDSNHGDPAARLHRVIETIDANSSDHMASNDYPMGRLDLLYKRIIFHVPDNAMISTRKMLLVCARGLFKGVGFRGQCNALGLTEKEAYDAIRYLSAVIRIPELDQADDVSLSYYHKSFEDFLFDFKRSGFSHNFMYEGLLLCHRTALKILEEIPYEFGGVAGGEGAGDDSQNSCDGIPLSWPGDQRFRINDRELRTKLYGNTLNWVCKYFNGNGIFHGRLSCFHALTTRFAVPDDSFPFYRLRDGALDVFRDELTKLGRLKQVPLRAFDYSAICGDIELLFVSPTGKNVKVTNPWGQSCEHSKRRIGAFQQLRGWSTEFKRYYRVDAGVEDTDIPRFDIATCQPTHESWCASDRSSKHATVHCVHCSRRFARQFMDNLDVSAMVFVDSTGMCYVEVSFVDPGDGVSQWRYRFLHSGLPTGVDA